MKKSDRHSLIDPHSGKKVYYGKGKKRNNDLKIFDNKRDNYWDDLADEWLKKNS
jgi:hypothetical protein